MRSDPETSGASGGDRAFLSSWAIALVRFVAAAVVLDPLRKGSHQFGRHHFASTARMNHAFGQRFDEHAVAPRAVAQRKQQHDRATEQPGQFGRCLRQPHFATEQAHRDRTRATPELVSIRENRDMLAAAEPFANREHRLDRGGVDEDHAVTNLGRHLAEEAVDALRVVGVHQHVHDFAGPLG